MTTCVHCQQSVQVPKKEWESALIGLNLLKMLKAKEGESVHEPTLSENTARGLDGSIVKSVPRCLRCETALPTPPHAGEQFFNERVTSDCGACGFENVFEVPRTTIRLSQCTITHVSATEGQTTPEGNAVLPDTEAVKPITMGCPSCGGALHFTVESSRTTACTYCAASVYIPDGLWRQLHPVKKAQYWNLIVQTTPQQLRTAGRLGLWGTILFWLLILGGGASGLAVGAWNFIQDERYLTAFCFIAILGFMTMVFSLVVFGAFRDRMGAMRLAAQVERTLKERRHG